ncbi:hypothetical protein PhCBS80983_g06418 [Powellomyces hirtus]|uniref:Chromo domain-containing protein n=1 Tax=Powellomyces hirtus TaxID=109895 RepID=A0A507DN07_9FUNG|nr:hypothetical protein PhCBS80983_g06418 [Powellomyces hirtus]
MQPAKTRYPEQPHLSRRQAGWVEFPGTWNSIADFLSCDPTYAPKCATCQAKIDVVTAIVQPEITVTMHMPTDADWTRALASDDFGQNILLTIDGPQENLSGHARRFRTVDSPLHRFLICLTPTNTRATAQGTAQLFLEQAFRHTGLPHTIVSDRDAKWLSEFWRSLMRALDVKQALLLARHQQTDSKAENAIKTIKGIMGPFLDYAGFNWKGLLPTLQYNYNRTAQTSTGLSPFEIDLGRVPWSRIMQQRLRDAQDQQVKYYDRKKHTEAYREGDKVLLHWEVRGKGPHPDTYKLELPKEFTGLHPVFHVSILRRYHDPGGTPYRQVTAPPEPKKDEDGQETYRVDKILNARWHRNTEQFLVKWTGYNNTQNTWEPYAHVKGTTALEEWLREHPGGDRGKRLAARRRKGT